MAYQGYKQQQQKTPELMAIEEYHQDMAVLRTLMITGATRAKMLENAESILEDYWELWIKGTPREEQIRRIREKARKDGNQFALMKAIRSVIKGAAVEAGFYGQVHTATNKPVKDETTQTQEAKQDIPKGPD
jgi:hypothetical protein